MSGYRTIRAANIKIELADALMSGFAMFSLKDSSLLAFDQRRVKDDNLKSVYGLNAIPCDSQMRTILDPVSPDELKPLFKEVIGSLLLKYYQGRSAPLSQK